MPLQNPKSEGPRCQIVNPIQGLLGGSWDFELFKGLFRGLFKGLYKGSIGGLGFIVYLEDRGT